MQPERVKGLVRAAVSPFTVLDWTARKVGRLYAALLNIYTNGETQSVCNLSMQVSNILRALVVVLTFI